MIFRKFWNSRHGNFAVMFGVAIIPVLLAAGMAVDYSRSLRAKSHLQDLADAASLALAAANIQEEAELREHAEKYVLANFDSRIVDEVTIGDVLLKNDAYDVELKGKIHTYFMSIANIDALNVNTSALAIRGINGSVEVALVLDNTNSMSGKDAKGVAKIDALKSAAAELVEALHKNKDATVRISVVPYADYVNVGLSNRNQNWISVDDDYTVKSEPPKNCGVPVTKTSNQCVAWGPQRTCTRVNDGVVESYSCRDCVKTEPKTTTWTPSCEVTTTTYEWFGCVGTRVSGSLRLSDASPNNPYPGHLDTIQRCPVEIAPLTSDEAPIQAAISKMKAGSDKYMANTYIPAGLVWGLNVLSGTAPFKEGRAYDPSNLDPRKVVVLMTDGENTMRYTADGKHVGMNVVDKSGEKAVYNPDQVKKTRDDTLALCKNIKDQKIEIFSVAFSVDSADSKSLLETCATDKDHYFDAMDSTALSLAFSEIVTALTNIRLAR